MNELSGKNHIPKIKICGITDVREAEYLNRYKVDYAGFVFYPPSKRNVTVDAAVRIAQALDASIKKVAVMVSPSVKDIEMIQNAGFADIIQIHKELSPDVIKACRLPVWRAVNLDKDMNLEEITKPGAADADHADESADKVEAILVDAPDFGSGRTFDWNLKLDLQGDKKFVLAGGLNPSNVAEGIMIFSPDIVDVSSGVEGASGKDEQKIAVFVHAVRGEVNEQ